MEIVTQFSFYFAKPCDYENVTDIKSAFMKCPVKPYFYFKVDFIKDLNEDMSSNKTKERNFEQYFFRN